MISFSPVPSMQGLFVFVLAEIQFLFARKKKKKCSSCDITMKSERLKHWTQLAQAVGKESNTPCSLLRLYTSFSSSTLCWFFVQPLVIISLTIVKIVVNFLFVHLLQPKTDSFSTGKAHAYESLQDSSYWAKVLYCFIDHVSTCRQWYSNIHQCSRHDPFVSVCWSVGYCEGSRNG